LDFIIGPVDLLELDQEEEDECEVDWLWLEEELQDEPLDQELDEE